MPIANPPLLPRMKVAKPVQVLLSPLVQKPSSLRMDIVRVISMFGSQERCENRGHKSDIRKGCQNERRERDHKGDSGLREWHIQSNTNQVDS